MISTLVILLLLSCTNKLKSENKYLYKRINELKADLENTKIELSTVSNQNFKIQYDSLLQKHNKLEKKYYEYTFYERDINIKIDFYNQLVRYLLNKNKFDDIEISGIVAVGNKVNGMKIIAKNQVNDKQYDIISNEIECKNNDCYCKYKMKLPVGIYNLYSEYLDGKVFDRYKFTGYVAIYPEVDNTDINIYTQ